MSMRAIAAVLGLVIAACSRTASTSTASAGQKIRVATTISTLNSLVEGVGGNNVQVQNIVPIGASPETFQPAPQDVAVVANAQLLVENGAGLEAWLGKTLGDSGNANLRTVVCTDGLPVQNDNPHLWMDPVYTQRYVRNIRDGLIAVDPQHAAQYRRNADAYEVRIGQLRDSIQRKIDTLPMSHRYMIVFHNAFYYYDRRFGLTTLGFVERNPGQEPNPQQIADLIDLAKSHGVRAVFSEPEYSPKLLYSIAAGAGVKVVENLYDDSIGTDPRVSNYISMLEYDTDIIVKSLR
jgi:manganese/iron transport system substrate-binding protein